MGKLKKSVRDRFVGCAVRVKREGFLVFATKRVVLGEFGGKSDESLFVLVKEEVLFFPRKGRFSNGLMGETEKRCDSRNGLRKK